MRCVALTSKIAGVVGGSVRAVAANAELGDVERNKVELGHVLHVGSVLELMADAMVEASWVLGR